MNRLVVAALAVCLTLPLLAGCRGLRPLQSNVLPPLTYTPQPTVARLPTSRPSTTPTPTPHPSATPVPTVTPTPGPTLTATPSPTITPTPLCDCSSNNYDCVDFSTHDEAQNCYEYCLETVGEDVHHLDGDEDGSACERLP